MRLPYRRGAIWSLVLLTVWTGTLLAGPLLVRRAIDHGIAFHHEFKLRTVLWDFADQPLPEAIVRDLCALLDRGLPSSAAVLLDPLERDAVLTRTRALVTAGRFPRDDTGGRRWPWPLV